MIRETVNFSLHIHKIVEPSTKTVPVMGKVLMLFSLQVKDLPQQMQVQALSHLPVAGWHGVVWHGVAWGRQGQIRKWPTAGCVPRCSAEPARASCGRANHARAHIAADALPRERRYILRAANRVTPNKSFPFSQDTYSFLGRL